MYLQHLMGEHGGGREIEKCWKKHRLHTAAHDTVKDIARKQTQPQEGVLHVGILTLKFSILKGTPQILLTCILKNANVIIFPKNDTFW